MTKPQEKIISVKYICSKTDHTHDHAPKDRQHSRKRQDFRKLGPGLHGSGNQISKDPHNGGHRKIKKKFLFSDLPDSFYIFPHHKHLLYADLQILQQFPGKIPHKAVSRCRNRQPEQGIFLQKQEGNLYP